MPYASKEKKKAHDRAYSQTYHQAHPEEIRAYGRAYSQTYREAHPEEVKAYRLAHPEMTNARTRKHRALKRGVKHQPYKVEDIIARDRGLCGLCGKKVAKADQSIDHILPLSLGGADAPHNVQLAHIRCNQQKGNSARFPANLRLALA